MPMLNDIAAQLATAGLGTVGTDIFIGRMPETPDECIAVRQAGGDPPAIEWNGEYPVVQVHVRSTTINAAEALANDVYLALHKLTNTTINSHLYIYVKANHTPAQTHIDEEDRSHWVMNFSITRETEA